MVYDVSVPGLIASRCHSTGVNSFVYSLLLKKVLQDNNCREHQKKPADVLTMFRDHGPPELKSFCNNGLTLTLQ
jgi:hypothetical protein